MHRTEAATTGEPQRSRCRLLAYRRKYVARDANGARNAG